MELMYPMVEFFTEPYKDMVRRCTIASGLCYNVDRSNHPINEMEEYLRKQIKAKHESVIEHASMSILFTCDRGISHELVRHRLSSFTQTSTRYCDYTGEREDGEVKYIIPVWCDGIVPGTYKVPNYRSENKVSHEESEWWDHMLACEQTYASLRSQGWTAQQARSVLPNSLMTRIMVTANMRQWRHIFALRAIGTTGAPHPQMLEIMVPAFMNAKHRFPVFFQDMDCDTTGDYSHVEVI